MRGLRTLLAIHDAGSFKKAAERLNMTLSAVSIQMKELEAIYGIALFDRSFRPPALTSAGLQLVAASRGIVTAFDDLPLLLRSGPALSGSLSLGFVATASIRLLPEAVRHLSVRFPALELRVESALSTELAERVGRGDLDAAVVTETRELHRNCAVSRLVDDPLVLVASRAERRRLTPDLLRHKPFIRFQARSGVGRIVDEFLLDRAFEIRQTMTLDSLEAIVELVASDLGVTIIPLPEAQRYGRGRVRWTALRGHGLSRSLALITRQTPGSRHLHNALLEALRQPVRPGRVRGDRC
jgi:DNA-binding transcriptional LysR family regulator